MIEEANESQTMTVALQHATEFVHLTYITSFLDALANRLIDFEPASNNEDKELTVTHDPLEVACRSLRSFLNKMSEIAMLARFKPACKRLIERLFEFCVERIKFKMIAIENESKHDHFLPHWIHFVAV